MRNALRNLHCRLMFLGLTLPTLGASGCLLDQEDLRNQAISSVEGFITALFSAAVSNAVDAVTG